MAPVTPSIAMDFSALRFNLDPSLYRLRLESALYRFKRVHWNGALRVAVLFGGRSSERSISMASGRAVCRGLSEAGHVPIPVIVDEAGAWRRNDKIVRLEPGGGLKGVDVAFPALHGAFGEDGTVQGLLECLDLPYVGCGVLASAVCLDKLVFKGLMRSAGIRQADYRAVQLEQFRSDRNAVLDRLACLGLPAFVKPARLGSSFGVTRVSSADQLPRALEVAFEHDVVAIVEAAVEGVEIECVVIGNDQLFVSQPGELLFASDRSGWFDCDTKFTPGAFQLVLPARVPEPVREQIRELAAKAFVVTGCRGLARVDFLVDGQDIFVNEVNTMPGLVRTGVFALIMEDSGLAYPQVLDRLLKLALERYDATGWVGAPGGSGWSIGTVRDSLNRQVHA